MSGNPLNKFMFKQPYGNVLSEKYPDGITTARLGKELGFHKPEWQSLRVQGLLPNRSVKLSGENLARLDLERFVAAANDTAWLPSHRVTELIGVPETVFRAIVGKDPVGSVFGYDMWTRSNVDDVTGTPEYAAAKESLTGSRFSKRRATKAAKMARLEAFETKANDVVSRVTADPLAVGRSDRCVLYVGPTNSGKTFTALEELAERFHAGHPGRFVYAGPLRLLASEVFETLCHRLGKNNVGIITGQEVVRPDAPVICATVECAASITNIDTLIVDEAHWALDSSRGHSWSRLLVSTPAKNKHVISGLDAKEVLIDALKPSQVIEKTRLSRLSKGPCGRKQAVIAFSRKEVLDIARKMGPSAIPLYGAMPIDTKKRQIKLFNNDASITTIVATDVIGHGLNLPIDTVTLTSGTKFDGLGVRELYDWELAQIIGRAGRYGNPGTVLADRLDPAVIDRGIRIANGDEQARDAIIRRLSIVPSLPMLGLRNGETEFIPHAVKRWQELAGGYSTNSVYAPGDVTRLLDNADVVIPRCRRAPLTAVWSLVNGPFDRESVALKAGARYLATGSTRGLSDDYAAAANLGHGLESLEAATKNIGEFRALAVVLGLGRDLTRSVTYDRMLGDERRLSRKIDALLDELSRRRRS